MGVLACDRTGCDNIMCDHYSPEHGYLCWECLQELKEKGFCNVEDFMLSEKTVQQDVGDWEDFVENLFRDRNKD